MGNPKRTVYDLFLNTPTDKYNKEIYLQAQKLFSLREGIFRKLTNKGIINNDFIAERNMLRKHRLNEIDKKEKTINNNFFKEHFEYSSPNNMSKI